MALPSTIYVSTNLVKKPVPISGVITWKHCAWWECRESYRDTGWPGGKVAPSASGVGVITADPGLPGVGKEGEAVTVNTWNGLRHTTPDDWAHVPPRPKWLVETGIVVQTVTSNVPDTLGVNDTRHSLPVTVSTTTHELTPVFAGAPDVWEMWTPVRICGTTQPGGSRPNVYYRLVKVQHLGTWKLLGPDGKLVTFTSAGTEVCLIPAPVLPRPLDSYSGLIVFRDSLDPRVATSA